MPEIQLNELSPNAPTSCSYPNTPPPPPPPGSPPGRPRAGRESLNSVPSLRIVKSWMKVMLTTITVFCLVLGLITIGFSAHALYQYVNKIGSIYPLLKILSYMLLTYGALMVTAALLNSWGIAYEDRRMLELVLWLLSVTLVLILFSYNELYPRMDGKLDPMCIQNTTHETNFCQEIIQEFQERMMVVPKYLFEKGCEEKMKEALKNIHSQYEIIVKFSIVLVVGSFFTIGYICCFIEATQNRPIKMLARQTGRVNRRGITENPNVLYEDTRL